MQAIRLKTEHLINPMGVDFTATRLSWNCDGGVKQTAYQILAADDAGTVLWDSGRVESSAMCAQWGGAPVEPKTKVLWKVQLWDEEAAAGDWSEATFETGIGTSRCSTGGRATGIRRRSSGRYPAPCRRRSRGRFQTEC